MSLPRLLDSVAAAWQGRSVAPRHLRTVLTALAVFAVAVAAVVITAQGWRSRVPAFDLLPYVHAVRELLAEGTIPVHGDTGSYGSFKPPGTAWLMVPSTLLFDDPRASEYAGTALLHLATLTGLFLLGRKYFGVRCAFLAVLLYGLSATGLFLAGSLWPNGRPDVFVWTVYLASEWVTRRDPRFLAAALAVWGLGMYIDLAHTPVLLIFPVLWLLYRAPVRVSPLLAAAALLLVVWFPYLRFEADRGFADMRSQLLFQSIRPTDYTDSWCDPSLTLRRLGEAPPAVAAAAAPALLVADTSRAEPVRRRVEEMKGKLTANFDVRIPGLGPVLAGLVLVSLLLFVVPGTATGRDGLDGRASTWLHRLSLLALPAVLAALLLNRFVVPPLADVGGVAESGASILHRLGRLIALAGVALLAARASAAIANRLLVRTGARPLDDDWLAHRRPVAVALAVPWLVLLAVAEPGKPERFMWLWPLQAIFIAAFVTVLLPRLGAPALLRRSLVAALVALIVGNSFVESRIEAWRADGWSGRDAPAVHVVDHVAEDLAGHGANEADIGYHLFIYRFMAAYNTVNPQYKVGAEFDLLFRYRRGIANTNTCAEGISPRDDYRIVQTTPEPESWRPREYVDIAVGPGFRPIEQLGPYRILRRDR